MTGRPPPKVPSITGSVQHEAHVDLTLVPLLLRQQQSSEEAVGGVQVDAAEEHAQALGDDAGRHVPAAGQWSIAGPRSSVMLPQTNDKRQSADLQVLSLRKGPEASSH